VNTSSRTSPPGRRKPRGQGKPGGERKPSGGLPAPATPPSGREPTEPEAPVISASLARRFGALVIDWLLCVGVSLFSGRPMAQLGFIPVGVLILEYAFFLGLFAQTPGMRLLGLRCVSFTTGDRIGILRALLRGVLLALVVPALLMDKHQRGLHDRLVGSVVIGKPDPTHPAERDGDT
jgi:uncharacterized RDD family membrane protein YckC